MEEKTPAGQPIVDREKVRDLTSELTLHLTTPSPGFALSHTRIRQSWHVSSPFPISRRAPSDRRRVADIYVVRSIDLWLRGRVDVEIILARYRKDATLFELLTTIRNSAPSTLEYRHPLARYSFRTIYADAGNRGLFAQKDLGTVYSRDTLGDLGTVEQLLEDDRVQDNSERQKDARTLDELRFVPGDYLCVSVTLPKNVQANFSADPSAPKGGPGGLSPSLAPANGWKSGGGLGRGANNASLGLGHAGMGPGAGRGGGHWRGGSDAPPQPARGRGERGGDFAGVAGRADRDRDRERDGGRFRDERDRRPPVPRRESPPARAPRDRRSLSRSRSRSRSRSPQGRRRR